MKHKLSSLPLSNSFQSLGDRFFSDVQPTPFESSPQLVHFNAQAARLLELDPDVVNNDCLVDVFTGKQLLEESDPIPMLYASHQFDQINPPG